MASGSLGTNIGIALGAATGLILGALLASVYAGAQALTPWVELRWMFPLLFGGVLGRAAPAVMRRSSAHHPKAAVFIVCLSVTVAYGLHWVFWIPELPGRGEMPLLWSPADLFGQIAIAYREGTWAIGTVPVSGWPLGLLWVLEAATIFGAAFWTLHHALTQQVYCEACGCFCEPLAPVAVQGSPELESAARQQNWQALAQPKPDGAPRFVELVVHQCGRCNTFATLTLKRVRMLLGAVPHKRTTVDRRTISGKELEALQSHLGRTGHNFRRR